MHIKASREKEFFHSFIHKERFMRLFEFDRLRQRMKGSGT